MKTYMIFLIVTLGLISVSCGDVTRKKNLPWQDLLKDKDLGGWIQRGGDAVFEVKDNNIVGTSVTNTPNSFICTEKEYGDFILELEFRVDPGLNSGVQIRSISDLQYKDGRVHGYQVEIDPSERAWTGGIYDEARMGWLYPLSGEKHKEARNAFHRNKWNTLRVEAIGSQIKTWVNEIPVANLFVDETSKGFIALQVHSVRDSSLEGAQVRWRNIRIITESPEQFARESGALERSYLTNRLTENEIARGWKLLFDGKTSNGWRKAGGDNFPENGWVIEDGILSVKSGGGHIVTNKMFTNFDLMLQVRLTPRANSGVKYFVTEPETIGAEYQILDDERHPNAQKDDRTFGAFYDVIAPKNVRANSIGQWNNIRIVVEGRHVEHWLNGFRILKYDRKSDEFRQLVADSKFSDRPGFAQADSGRIQLQDHGDVVSFRSIKIRTWE